MNRDDVIDMAPVGKSVLISLRNGFHYTCSVIEHREDNFKVRDKYGKLANIRYDAVESVGEQ